MSNEDCPTGSECFDGVCSPFDVDGSACRGSELLCRGVCVNSRTDPQHCGSCGVRCRSDENCVGGICRADPCPESQVRCGSGCVDISTSVEHCGACEQRCGASEVCSSGSCMPACEATTPAVEVCGDGIDNDCDGNVDSAECGPSMIGWYRFENKGGPILDSSGRGNDGQARNGATRVDDGWRGVAIQIDGAKITRVTVPDSPDYSFTTSMTVEAWVNPTSCPAGSGDIHTAVSMNNVFRLQFRNSCQLLSEVYTNSAWRADEPAVSIVPGRWNHLALVWNGSQLQTYLDGNTAGGATDVSGMPADPPNAMHFGAFCASSDSCDNTMVGRLDEVKIWSSARTAEEVCADAGGTIDSSRGGCTFD